MKQRLTFSESFWIGLLLFGLFFGAGNLIFPVELGAQSGSNLLPASMGFLVTGVGMAVLGVVASAISRSDSLFELAKPASRGFAYFFTIALYLTIGPFFAIPRTATVAFEVGVGVFVQEGQMQTALLIFSSLFFIIALFFALRPNDLIKSIGKFMTPLFLILLSVLVILAFIKPMGAVASGQPTSKYMENAFFVGLIDGYNTMDGLAALAFAIIIIQNIRKMGVNKPRQVAIEIVKSSIITLLAMSLVYLSLTYIGSSGLAVTQANNNGAVILSDVARHYLGLYGRILLAGIVIVACIKTGIGIISACGEIFASMFPNFLSYKIYAVIFTAIAFLIANLGLATIISLSLPVLMFLYPLAIALIILSFASPFINKSKIVYQTTLLFTVFAAFFDFIKAAPGFISQHNLSLKLIDFADNYLPAYKLGFGWLIPTSLGFIVGLVLWRMNTRKNTDSSF